MTPANDKKLLKLLNFLVDSRYADITKKNESVFYIDKLSLGDNFQDYDSFYINIDFSKREFTEYRSYVSGHNGDTFGETSVFLSWGKIDQIYDYLFEQALVFLKKKREALENSRTLSDTEGQLERIIG